MSKNRLSRSRHSSQGRLEEFLTPEALEISMELILSPQHRVERVIENVEVEEGVAIRRITRQIRTHGEPFLVPFMLVPRERVSDIITFITSPEIPGGALGRRTTGVVQERLLVAAAKPLSVDIDDPWVSSVLKAPQIDLALAREMLLLLARVAASETSGDGTPLIPVDELPISSELSKLAKSQAFVNLYRSIVAYALILLPARPSGEFLSVQYTMENSTHEFVSKTVRQGFRRSLGATPSRIEFELSGALRAESYHFRLRAASGQFISTVTPFVASRSVVQRHSSRRNKDELLGWTPLDSSHLQAGMHVEYQKYDADGLVHWYSRDMAANDKSRLKRVLLVLEFRERPVGQTGAMAARMCAMVLAGLVLLRYGSFLVRAGSASAIALVLALPGALGISSLLSIGKPASGTIAFARFGSWVIALSALALAICGIEWSTRYEMSKNYHMSSVEGWLIVGELAVSGATLLIAIVLLISNISKYVQSTNSVKRIVCLDGK